MHMDKMISVIVPAYNAEDYIERCLNSILNQTYRNFEIIVVNDGSTDATGNIIDKMAKENSKIYCLHTDNGGVSRARNQGIERARGEYLTFVDSDDWIESDMLSLLMNDIQKYDADISMCSYWSFYSGEAKPIGNQGNITVLDKDHALECLLKGRLFSGGLWAKLYHKSLLEGLQLNEQIRYNEDILMNFHIFQRVTTCIYNDACKYHYEENLASATHLAETDYGLNKDNDLYHVWREIKNECRETFLEKAALNRYCIVLLGYYQDYILAGKKEESGAKKLRKYMISIHASKYMVRQNDKIKYYLFCHMPQIGVKVYRFYDSHHQKQLDPIQ